VKYHNWFYDGVWIPTYDLGKVEILILLEVLTVIVEAVIIYMLKLKSDDVICVAETGRLTWLESFEISLMTNVISFLVGFFLLFITGYFNV
jgi:hypothetical protein